MISSIFIADSWKPLQKTLDASGHILVPVAQNLVDVVWEDRPQPPSNPLITLAQKYTGR